MSTDVHLNKWLLSAAISLPAIAVFFFIALYSVNVPYMDQWNGLTEMLPAMKNGSLSFHHLWKQHNEHRLIFPKMIMLLLASITHWNVVYEQYFSFFIQACTLLLILSLSKRTLLPERDHLAAPFQVFSSMFLFSMVQYENWSWGWQIQIFLNVFSACFTFWALSYWKDTWKGFILAVIGATISTYSFANGILIWAIVFLWLLFSKSNHRPLYIIIWVSAASAITFSYFYHYTKPEYHPSLLGFLKYPVNFLAFFFTYIGSPFGIYFGLKGSIIFGILGVGTLLFLIFRLYTHRHNDLFEKSLPWLGLIMYVIMSALITGIGRSGFGAKQALFSRYTTFSIFFWVSLLALAFLYFNIPQRYKHFSSSKINSSILTLLFVPLLLFYSLSYAKGVSAFKNHFSRLAYIHSLFEYKFIYNANESLNYIYPSIHYLFNAINQLKGMKMGPFYREIMHPKGIIIACGSFHKTGSEYSQSWVDKYTLVIDKNSYLPITIKIPESGIYDFSAEMEVIPGRDGLLFRIDHTIMKIKNYNALHTTEGNKMSGTFKWVSYGVIHLSKGFHKLIIYGTKSQSALRAVRLLEFKRLID